MALDRLALPGLLDLGEMPVPAEGLELQVDLEILDHLVQEEPLEQQVINDFIFCK